MLAPDVLQRCLAPIGLPTVYTLRRPYSSCMGHISQVSWTPIRPSQSTSSICPYIPLTASDQAFKLISFRGGAGCHAEVAKQEKAFRQVRFV